MQGAYSPPRACNAGRRTCRLEPLALLPGEVQRAAFVPLFKGGKRIHLAMQARSRSAAAGLG